MALVTSPWTYMTNNTAWFLNPNTSMPTLTLQTMQDAMSMIREQPFQPQTMRVILNTPQPEKVIKACPSNFADFLRSKGVL